MYYGVTGRFIFHFFLICIKQFKKKEFAELRVNFSCYLHCCAFHQVIGKWHLSLQGDVGIQPLECTLQSIRRAGKKRVLQTEKVKQLEVTVLNNNQV